MKTALILEADRREAYWQLLLEGMLVFLALGPPRPSGTPPREGNIDTTLGRVLMVPGFGPSGHPSGEGNEVLNPTVASRLRFPMKARWAGVKA